MANSKSFMYKLSLFTTVFAAIVVILGAYTRLVDAGLGCPDWPGCYGFLSVPDTSEEIQRAQQAFPHAPLESEKAWPEMVHRYFAGTLGLLIALMAVIAIINRQQATQPVALPVILVGLVIFQAALGMWTVTMGLLPIIVMGHLLGGMLTLMLIWLLHLKIRNGNVAAWGNVTRLLAMIGALVVFIQISLGGWTSANYAAIICSDFPTCQGHWIPPLDFSAAFETHAPALDSYLGGFMANDARVTVHWLHRLGALVTTLYLLFLTVRLYRVRQKRFALWLLAVLSLQLGIGISNVVYSLPLAVAVAHNAVAAVLFLSLVTVVHYLGLSRNQI